MPVEPRPAPPPPADPLADYLDALREGASGRQAALEGRHPELAGDFAALRRTWERLGVRLSIAPSDAARARSSAPGSSQAALGAGAIAESRLERLRARRLDHRYEVGAEIARGGMGSIKSVWDTDLRRRLAMKVMLRAQDRDPSAVSRPPDGRLLARFLEEAQITAQLDHPGILPVHEIGLDEEGRLFFTMPLVEGRHLGEVLRLARDGQGGWTTTRAVGVLLKVTEAVAFAHTRGVVHRDLKPENVMVGRFGEAYVMDWGLARVLEAADKLGEPQTALGAATKRKKTRVERVRTDRAERDTPAEERFVTLDGDVVGTPGYMAPEQALGDRSRIGQPADIYALGAILYQLLSGHAPHLDPASRSSKVPLLERILEHEPARLADLAPDAPEELVAIATKAMQRDPGARYASAERLAEDLRAYLEGRVVSAHETGVIAQVKKWVARNRLLAAAYAMVALSVVAGVVLFVRQQQLNLDRLSEEQERTELARRDADAARRRAEAGELTALIRGYSANVSAADLALRSSDAGEARRRLDACPAELRGFEWHHLVAQLDTSLGTSALVGERVAAAGFHENRTLAVLRHPRRGLLEFATWDVASGERALVREIEFAEDEWRRGEPPTPPAGVAVRPDGRAVALGLPDGRLWVVPLERADAPVIELARVLVDDDADRASDEPPAPADLLAWSADGEWLVAASSATTNVDFAHCGIARYAPARAATGEEIAPGARRPTALAFDPRGPRVAIGYDDGAVALWRVVGGGTDRPEGVLLGHDGALASVAFSPDGTRLASSASDRTVRVVDAIGGKLITVRRRTASAVDRLLFASDLLAGSSPDGEITIWHDRDDRRSIVQRGLPATCIALAAVADDERLWTVTRDGALQAWDARGSAAVTDLALRNLRLTTFDLSADGSRLLLTRQMRSEVWDAHGLESLFAVTAERGETFEVGRFLDGGRLLACSFDGTTARSGLSYGGVLADGASGAIVARFVSPPEAQEAGTMPTRLTAATGTGRVAIAYQSGHVSVYDTRATPDAAGELRPERTFAVTEPSERPSFGRGPDVVTALELSADGEVLVLVDRRGAVEVFDADTGTRVARCDLPLLPEGAPANADVPRIALHPNGRLLAATVLDEEGVPSRIAVFDTRTGVERTRWDGHSVPIQCLAFDHDGTRLASGAADGAVRLWDSASGEALLLLDGHETDVVNLAFSGDGSRFASASREGTIRIHETTSPRERFESRVTNAGYRRMALLVLGDRAGAAPKGESVAEPVKKALDRISKLLADHPARLNSDAWEVVSRPDATRDEYQFALMRAQAAVRGDHEEPIYERTLGVAHYRLGQHREAIATLERSSARHRRGPTPPELAVLALAHHALEQSAEAEEYRERFERMMVDAYHARSADARSLLAELDALDDATWQPPAEGESGAGAPFEAPQDR